MNLLDAVLLSVLVLYAWAALFFLFFRFSGPETPERQRQFLESHVFFYTFRPFSQVKKEMTRQTMREAGRRGWGVLLLALQLLYHGMTSTNLWVSMGVLHIGGLTFAYSWYGQRCLRMLGLEIYEKAAA